MQQADFKHCATDDSNIWNNQEGSISMKRIKNTSTLKRVAFILTTEQRKKNTTHTYTYQRKKKKKKEEKKKQQIESAVTRCSLFMLRDFSIFKRSSLPLLPLHILTRTFYSIVLLLRDREKNQQQQQQRYSQCTSFPLHSKSFFSLSTVMHLYMQYVFFLIFFRLYSFRVQECIALILAHITNAKRTFDENANLFSSLFFRLLLPNVSHFYSSYFFCISFDCHSIHLCVCVCECRHSIESKGIKC